VAIEVLNMVVMIRVPKAELDDTIRKIRSGEIVPVGVPAGVSRKTVNHHPQGSTDPEWPQIRIEYMK
jgi:hypothetical protein